MRSLIVLALALCAVSAIPMEDSKYWELVNGTNHFSSDFFKRVVKDHMDYNFVSSPISVYMLLSMIAYGSSGNTYKQMHTGLHLPVEDSVGYDGFRYFMNEFKNVEYMTFDVANRMYVPRNFDVMSDYKKVVGDYFYSEIYNYDYEHPFLAAKYINAWVEEKTHGKITNIVKDTDFFPTTRMFLINAVYYKGEWDTGFAVSEIADRPFYYMDQDVEKHYHVPTMYRYGKYFYGELPEFKFKFIELPYKNKDYVMVFYIPDEYDGLRKIEEHLDAFNYSRLADLRHERNVHFYLPKFRFESYMDLEHTLEYMGMTDMFSDAADFTKISTEKLKVSKVSHKTYIEVDEKGSEAAGISDAGFTAYSLTKSDDLTLKADRPFVFEIRDRKHYVSLFTGIVYNPLLHYL